jgi:hypothetical protein
MSKPAVQIWSHITVHTGVITVHLAGGNSNRFLACFTERGVNRANQNSAGEPGDVPIKGEKKSNSELQRLTSNPTRRPGPSHI